MEPDQQVPGYAFPMGSPEEDFRRQQEAAMEQQKKEATKAFTKQFIEKRGLDASQTGEAALQKAQTTKAPLNLKVKTDDQGVSSVGLGVPIQISPRIGITGYGAVAPGRTARDDMMGVMIEGSAPTQFSGGVRYESPFINVDVEHSPGSGFGGRMNMRTMW